MRLGIVLAVVSLVVAASANGGAAPAPISANPTVVGWAKASGLEGSFAGARHDDLVQLEERRCGATQFTRWLEVPSAPDGGWHVFASPPITTAYRARFRDQLSGVVTVRVRPQVVVREQRRGQFLVTTLAYKPFWRRTGVFERFSPSSGRWLRVKTFVFTESGATGGVTAWSKGRFRSRLPGGTLVRALLPSSQARPCYEAGVSNMLRTG